MSESITEKTSDSQDELPPPEEAEPQLASSHGEPAETVNTAPDASNPVPPAGESDRASEPDPAVGSSEDALAEADLPESPPLSSEPPRPEGRAAEADAWGDADAEDGADAVADADDGGADGDGADGGGTGGVGADGIGTGGVGADGGGADGGGADGGGAGDGGDVDDAPITGEALLVQEGEIAGDYLEQLLDILDYDGDIDLDVEGSRAIVAIVGANDLDPLVGARGVTLDALQELTRLTVAQQTGVRTRMMLDIGGYRAGRRTELSELAATNVARVIESGDTIRMSPMNAFERKIVHDVVTATDGVRSESEGEDPDRRVVILPER